MVVGSALIDRILAARDNAQAVRMSSPCAASWPKACATFADQTLIMAFARRRATRCAWPCVARCQNREENSRSLSKRLIVRRLCRSLE